MDGGELVHLLIDFRLLMFISCRMLLCSPLAMVVNKIYLIKSR